MHLLLNTSISASTEKSTCTVLRYRAFCLFSTLQLLGYAQGAGLGGNTIGYVRNGCGTNAYNYRFEPVTVNPPTNWAVAGGFLLGFFLLMAPLMLYFKKPVMRELAEKTFSYTYEHYGLFWGISTTLCFCATAMLYFNGKTLALNGANAGDYQYVFPVLIAFIGCVCAVVATYLGVKLKIAIPSIYLFPASLLCCCSKMRARVMITSVVLWFDLIAMQLACHHGFVIILALPVAPIVISANVLLLVLAFSCFVHIIALVFTICASIGIPKHFRPTRNCQFIFHALILIPFLLAVVCFCAVVAFAGQYVTTEQNGFFTTLGSIISLVIFGVLSFGLKKFVSAWLKEPMNYQELKESAYERLE